MPDVQQSNYAQIIVQVKDKHDTAHLISHALADVSLEIRKGEYVSIAGPSGSGKSTLLSICLVTHSPHYARYADHVVHLFDGRISEQEELR